MKPTIGRIVIYCPTKAEQELFNNFQTKCPAIIVSVWSDTCVNLKVLHDGIYDRWKTSINKFDPSIKIPGTDLPSIENTWDWPVIEKINK